MSVTLSEVKRAARAHRAPLAGESAGYLVLALADQIVDAPRRVIADDVQLAEDGGLRMARGQASSDGEAETTLRELLDSLLLVASSGSTALLRASRRREPSGLSAFVSELESALIPVNRAAARRALARLQRETARALNSGVLPPEMAEPEPPKRRTPPPLPVVQVQSVTALPHVPEPEPELEIDIADDLQETRAIAVAPSEAEECELEFAELSAADLEVDDVPLEEPDALTIALDVRLPAAVEAAEADPVVALPEEACTRPEPIVLRRSQRPPALPATVAVSHAVVPELSESLSHTPTLGSLARELPQLSPEAIAELGRMNALDAAAQAFADAPEVGTDPMPEVKLLEPGEAIVPGKRSDVHELLAGFQVAEVDANPGLCRAIKEMADLDLTPAPFAAFTRP